jgi:hypothetical protein
MDEELGSNCREVRISPILKGMKHGELPKDAGCQIEPQRRVGKVRGLG